MVDPVTGDRELVAALRSMAKGPSARDIDAAANTAMKPMLAATKEAMVANRNYVGKWPAWFTQPKTGRQYVDAGIGVRRDGAPSTTRRSYRMGATGKRARFILHILEFGTAPHAQPNFHGGWMHPGSAPHPAMVPAFEEHKTEVVRSFSAEIIDRIERQANALGLRTRR